MTNRIQIFISDNEEIRAGIVTSVNRRIVHYRRRNALIKSFISSIFVVSAAGFAIPVINSAMAHVGHSGLSDIVYLFQSEGLGVLVYWKELALSIAESAPVLDMALIVTITLAFFYAARSLAHSVFMLGIYNRNLIQQ